MRTVHSWLIVSEKFTQLDAVRGKHSVVRNGGRRERERERERERKRERKRKKERKRERVRERKR